MYFRIGEDRFRMSSVSRYSKGQKKSVSTGKWYLTVWFGKNERLFAFSTNKELESVVAYMDNVFKVQVI